MTLTQFHHKLTRNAPGETGAALADDNANGDNAAAGNPPAAGEFDWVPEQFRTDDGFDREGLSTAFTENATALADLQAAEAARMDGIPEAPDGYDLSFPEDIDYGDLQLPEGFEAQIDPDDPVLEEARQWFHANGVKPDAAKQLMGLFAKQQAGEVARLEAEARENIQALGPQAEARITRVATALQNKIPNAEQRAALMRGTTNADALRALETLVSATGSTPKPQPRTLNTEGMAPEDVLKAVYAQNM